MRNVKQIEEDLSRLEKEGIRVYFAMIRETFGEEAFRKELEKTEEIDVEDVFKNLPYPAFAYEEWYSQALPAVKDLLPDRYGTFVSLYEPAAARETINAATYSIQDYFRSIEVLQGGLSIASRKDALPLVAKQIGIVKSAVSRIRSGLSNIRRLVEADIFDDEIDAARALLSKGFVRAAGVVTGVILEKRLSAMCRDRGIAIGKKNPTISDLNEELRSNGVYDIARWRHVAMLADYRNLCSHDRGAEPTEAQVLDLIEGTERLVRPGRE
jgi:hypothetical protein